MRGWLVISVLALAGCGEHQGKNPNYKFGGTPYGQYLVEREAALTTGDDAPEIIPIALPAKALTAQEIAGSDPVPVPQTMGAAAARRQGQPATVVRTPARSTMSGAPTRIVPDSMLPVSSSGPYAGSIPVLVRYAFAADHRPGTAIYGRARASASHAAQLCAGFDSADAAQTAFLAAGGPRQDPRGLDPDGDGYVCGWDPAPFRSGQL